MDPMSSKTPCILHTHFVQYSLADLRADGLPECGKEIWLSYDFRGGPQFNGASVPTLSFTRKSGMVFGGVVTYEQPCHIFPNGVEKDQVIISLQVCIAGQVAGVVQSKYVHTHEVVVPEGRSTPNTVSEFIYPPVRTPRQIPNGILFVIPSGLAID